VLLPAQSSAALRLVMCAPHQSAQPQEPLLAL
jgi:hypothetical protein